MEESKQLSNNLQGASLSGGLQIKNMDDLERMGKFLVACGYFDDIKSISQGGIKLLAGIELGVPTMAAMTGISIVKGKPVMSANLMAACLKRNEKYDYRITQHTDQECEIEFFEGEKSVGKSSFTMAEAQKAGLASKDNWRNYPKNMLFARALSNGVKWYASDIFLCAPMYTEDELGEATTPQQPEVVQVTDSIKEKAVVIDAEIIQEQPTATAQILETVEPKSKVGQMIKQGMKESERTDNVDNTVDKTA